MGVLEKLLIDFKHELKDGACLEMILGKHMKEYTHYLYIQILNKLNVSGYLSTEGYYFTV